MKQFHGFDKKHSFFEGWYLKHRRGGDSLALIPAFHLNQKGRPTCSLQIITGKNSFSVPYAASSLEIRPDKFDIRLGKNHFSETGMVLNIKREAVSIEGQIHYGRFTPPSSDFMGPFRFFPNMQCNHGVVSLYHSLKGTVSVNGTDLDFTGGMGYIEKDWGSSFPKVYTWTQCSWIDKKNRLPVCVMASAAEIPFFPKTFTGCLAAVYYGGREYRLATYLHAKILECSHRELLISQGNYLLHINLLKSDPSPLKAPSKGTMNRIVHESLCAAVRYQFYVKGKKIFDVIHPHASFEHGQPQNPSADPL